MLDRQTAQNILLKIKLAQKILVLGHAIPNPDGDSLGSILAMSELLRLSDKDFTTLAIGSVESFSYLPGIESLEKNPDNIEIKNYDLVIMLDFGQFKNSGIEEKLVSAKEQGIFFIQIDHHPLVQEVADITAVFDKASSTCELLFDFFSLVSFEINQQIATCLLSGIIYDTQNFTNLGTTANSLAAGAELMKSGAHFQEVTAHYLQNKQLPGLKLWSKALARLYKDPKTGMATTAIFREDLDETGASEEATEGVSNFLNSLGTAKAILVLKEEDGGKVKGSLRTTHDDVDVSLIAKRYGGGGHEKAAGFLVDGKIVRKDDGWKVVR